MDVKAPKSESMHIRRIDPDTYMTIRVMASRFRVTQAQVIEAAIYQFEQQLGTFIPLPNGWTRPRDF